MKEEFKVILSDHDLSTDDDCSYGIVVQTINEHPNYGQVRKNLNRMYFDLLLTNISIYYNTYLVVGYLQRFNV